MRLILTTIILTMLAQPVWATAEKSCETLHSSDTACVKRCQHIFALERHLKVLELGPIEGMSATIFQNFKIMQRSTQAELSDAIIVYEFFCNRNK